MIVLHHFFLIVGSLNKVSAVDSEALKRRDSAFSTKRGEPLPWPSEFAYDWASMNGLLNVIFRTEMDVLAKLAGELSSFEELIGAVSGV